MGMGQIHIGQNISFTTEENLLSIWLVTDSDNFKFTSIQEMTTTYFPAKWNLVIFVLYTLQFFISLYTFQFFQ